MNPFRIYSYSLFLPTIISSLGYTRVTAQLFTVPPNMVAFFSVILGCYFSDKFRARGPVIIAGCSLAIGGYIMLLASKTPAVQYGGLVIQLAFKVLLLTTAEPSLSLLVRDFPWQIHQKKCKMWKRTNVVTPGIFPSSPAVMGWYVTCELHYER